MLIVIGGHSRNIGKTSTAAAIIRSTAHCRWVAVKISKHRHGSRAGIPFVFAEERCRDGCSDSSRFLAAGAAGSFWLRAADQHLAAAIPALLGLQRLSPNIIVESNRVLDHLTPDLYIPMLDYAVDDFKESARRFFCRADAYVVVRRGERMPCWRNVPIEQIKRKPVFDVSPPDYGSGDLVEFVEAAIFGRLQAGLRPFEPVSGRVRAACDARPILRAV